MPKFSLVSVRKLDSCDFRIQKVMDEAIQLYDFIVVEGHRSIARQQALYKQGRTEPGEIVTQVDGINVKGMHNWIPSRAIDIAPYSYKLKGPDWDNRDGFLILTGIILGIAKALDIKLRWGGDWNGNWDMKDQKLHDLGHFELVD